MKVYILLILTCIIFSGCTNKPRKVDLQEECKYADPGAMLYNPHNCLQFLDKSSCKYVEGVLQCQRG